MKEEDFKFDEWACETRLTDPIIEALRREDYTTLGALTLLAMNRAAVKELKLEIHNSMRLKAALAPLQKTGGAHASVYEDVILKAPPEKKEVSEEKKVEEKKEEEKKEKAKNSEDKKEEEEEEKIES